MEIKSPLRVTPTVRVFQKQGEDAINYFNDGSCVSPRSITGIEIFEGRIALVKWFIDTTSEGFLQIVKEYVEQPELLTAYK